MYRIVCTLGVMACVGQEPVPVAIEPNLVATLAPDPDTVFNILAGKTRSVFRDALAR